MQILQMRKLNLEVQKEKVNNQICKASEWTDCLVLQACWVPKSTPLSPYFPTHFSSTLVSILPHNSFHTIIMMTLWAAVCIPLLIRYWDAGNLIIFPMVSWPGRIILYGQIQIRSWIWCWQICKTSLCRWHIGNAWDYWNRGGRGVTQSWSK